MMASVPTFQNLKPATAIARAWCKHPSSPSPAARCQTSARSLTFGSVARKAASNVASKEEGPPVLVLLSILPAVQSPLRTHFQRLFKWPGYTFFPRLSL